MNYGDPEWLFNLASGGWDWFVSLSAPKGADSEGDFATWVCWLEQNVGNGECITYIRAIEPKADGSVVFHSLFRNVPTETRWGWRQQWNGISEGNSWDRPLEGTGEGLIRHFFFVNKFLIIGVEDGRETTYKFGKSTDDSVDEF